MDSRFNPYVWNEAIDPRAGLLRIVFGLGTRAVDRSDDDYTRIVALNAPDRRPDPGEEDGVRRAQYKVDVLDLDGNQLITSDFATVEAHSPDLPLNLYASADARMARRAREQGRNTKPQRILTFDRLLKRTRFVEDMRGMLRALEDAYACPVDVEWTTNFQDDENYRVNLVQCRPLQAKMAAPVAEPPKNIDDEHRIIETTGPVIGPSRIDTVERFIYIVPAVYGQLPVRERYAVARLIGRLTHLDGGNEQTSTMLLGPGRWGTTTPSLGVPVSFAEINTISVLCEIVAMRDDLVPDVSMGTHFFSEMVEMDILYLAVMPNQQDHWLNKTLFEACPNKLASLLPDAAGQEELVKVFDAADLPGQPTVRLHADTVHQHVLCYIAPEEADKSS